MTTETTGTDDHTPGSTVTADRRTVADGGPPTAFEQAQAALLSSVDLDVTTQFVDLDAPLGRIQVLEHAPAPTGSSSTTDPPVVFVHGTMQFGAFAAPLLTRLEDTRVVTFDRPGYGLSDPYTYGAETIPAALNAVIEGVLDALDLDEVTLVGHSMGGTASLRFAVAYPDRVHRLVLIGALPGFPGTTPPLPIRLMTTPVLGAVLRRVQPSGEAGVREMASAFGEADTLPEYPALVHAMAAHEADPVRTAAGVSEFRALFSPFGWRRTARLREADLRAVTQPTTVVHGTRDPLGGPEAVRGAYALVPDVRVEVIDAGHIPYLGYPARCARIVDEARGLAGADAP